MFQSLDDAPSNAESKHAHVMPAGDSVIARRGACLLPAFGVRKSTCVSDHNLTVRRTDDEHQGQLHLSLRIGLTRSSLASSYSNLANKTQDMNISRSPLTCICSAYVTWHASLINTELRPDQGTVHSASQDTTGQSRTHVPRVKRTLKVGIAFLVRAGSHWHAPDGGRRLCWITTRSETGPCRFVLQ